MFVEPSGGRAASAGFFLLEAGDVAAMAPGTNTGAATPVSLFGGQADQVMMRKALNDVAAMIRGVAAKRGRNSELAEKAVLDARSFTDKEALDNKLVDLVAADQWDLFRKLNGREITRFDGRKQTLRLEAPQVVEYGKTTRERIISAIADPNLALVLLVIGALGIYIEFHSPGLIVPGVIGAIMVLLGLVRSFRAADQLGGSRAAAAGRCAVHPGSQVRHARRSGGRRGGGDGPGRAAAD